MKEPRPYQTKAINDVRDALRRVLRVVLVIPTGGGKTVCGSEMVRMAVARGSRCLWLAHRSELIDQAYDTLRGQGLSVGAICASSSREQNSHRPVQVASIETLRARKLQPQANLIVTDECHHAPSDSWSDFIRQYPRAHVVGLTATPQRGDGRGLGSAFDELVMGPTVAELIAAKALVPARIIAPKRRLDARRLARSPVDAYLAEGESRRCIVFSPDVAHAEKHTQEFLDAGISAALITGDSPDRASLLQRFRDGKIQVLVNCMVLTEGFDDTGVSCIILARGCGASGLYLQICGRGLRVHPGKVDCLIIDLTGTSHTHGAPDDDREYSLDGRGIRRVGAEAKFCKVCSAVYEEYPCGECGFEPDPLAEFRVTNDPLVKFAAKRKESHEERIGTVVRWIATARERGYKPGWVFGRYRAVYGEPLTSASFAQARRAGNPDHAAHPSGGEQDGPRKTGTE